MREVKWDSVAGLLFQTLPTGRAPARVFAGCATLRAAQSKVPFPDALVPRGCSSTQAAPLLQSGMVPDCIWLGAPVSSCFPLRCWVQHLSPLLPLQRDGAASPCPPSAGTAWRKPSETAALLGHRDQPAGEAALAAAIPPRSAAREEELLLQSHTSYYLPTKGSVCTAGREPEDRDSPGDLQRTCSRQAEALIAPDRYTLGHPSTWPGAAEPPGMLPTSLQPLSASKPPRQPLARVGFFPFQRTSSFQVSERRKRRCCCQHLATARCQYPV